MDDEQLEQLNRFRDKMDEVRDELTDIVAAMERGAVDARCAMEGLLTQMREFNATVERFNREVEEND